LTDVDAITLSVIRLVANAQLTLDVAGTAVVIAALMNTVFKGAICCISGSPEIRRPELEAALLMVIAMVSR
jgi:uncharacterized membrane protein (DUF4010 family)